MYEDVLRFRMDRDNEGNTPEASSQVVYHLNLYSPTRPHLYPPVLRFLMSSPELLSRLTADIEKQPAGDNQFRGSLIGGMSAESGANR
jgi:vacuolar protein sorting-associated protein 11